MHYGSGVPISLRWEKLIQRKQGLSENVTDYFAAFLRLSQNIHLTTEVQLYIFLSGLEKTTKFNLPIFNPPENLAESFHRAKFFNRLIKLSNVKSLRYFLLNWRS